MKRKHITYDWVVETLIAEVDDYDIDKYSFFVPVDETHFDPLVDNRDYLTTYNDAYAYKCELMAKGMDEKKIRIGLAREELDRHGELEGLSFTYVYDGPSHPQCGGPRKYQREIRRRPNQPPEPPSRLSPEEQEKFLNNWGTFLKNAIQCRLRSED